MDERSRVYRLPEVAGLNALLWVIQILVAIQYLTHGLLFIRPPAAMAEGIAGMGLASWFRQFIGLAEVLASIGLVLPALLRRVGWIMPLSSLGLTVVMISATVFHISRSEVPNAISAANLLLLLALTTYLRWKVVPIRSGAAR